MSLNISTLKVNDRVAIARRGSWSTHSEGIYIVKKVNKVRVILVRESDGYVREFSMRTGIEKGCDRYCSPFIETIADKVARDATTKAQRDLDAAWTQVEVAAKQKNLTALRERVAALEELLK